MNSDQDQPAPDAIQPDRPPPASGGATPPSEAAFRADRQPDNGQVTAVPPAPAPSEKVAAGRPPATARATAPVHQPGGGVIRWTLGLLLIMGFGWGLIILIGVLANIYKVGIPFDVAAGIASVLSLLLLLALERNLWLSRFMGLRLGPRSTPVKEALFFWLLGIVGLLFRSTVPPQTAAGPEPSPEPSAAPSEKGKEAPPESQDGFREVVETVVFVVVLVLLLKAFLAEAFVIPTGSMAPTLLGYHRNATCPQCGHTFSVNLSNQLDPERHSNVLVTGCTCPNCFNRFNFPPPKGP